jgi:hypothetical protein
MLLGTGVYKQQRHVAAANKFCMVGPNICGSLSMELATCHLSGDSNYGKVPRFFEKLCISFLDYFLVLLGTQQSF